jgi:hypothetical protein
MIRNREKVFNVRGRQTVLGLTQHTGDLGLGIRLQWHRGWFAISLHLLWVNLYIQYWAKPRVER